LEAIAPAVLGEVDHCPTGIRRGLAVDPSPLPGYLQQRRLHDVLGVAAVAGEQIRGTEQPGRRVPYELVKIAAQHVHPHAC
jgi:hypothetical protein